MKIRNFGYGFGSFRKLVMVKKAVNFGYDEHTNGLIRVSDPHPFLADPDLGF